MTRVWTRVISETRVERRMATPCGSLQWTSEQVRSDQIHTVTQCHYLLNIFISFTRTNYVQIRKLTQLSFQNSEINVIKQPKVEPIGIGSEG